MHLPRYANLDKEKVARKTISVGEGLKGSEIDHRVIPVADLFFKILMEAKTRKVWDDEKGRDRKPSSRDLIVLTRGKTTFNQHFKRSLEEFPPGSHLDGKGLRRSLVKEFLHQKLYGISLQLYRGHKPEEISEIDWKNYLDRLEYDPDGVLEMFKRDVVEPLEKILVPYRRKWSEVIQIELPRAT